MQSRLIHPLDRCPCDLFLLFSILHFWRRILLTWTLQVVGEKRFEKPIEKKLPMGRLLTLTRQCRYFRSNLQDIEKKEVWNFDLDDLNRPCIFFVVHLWVQWTGIAQLVDWQRQGHMSIGIWFRKATGPDIHLDGRYNQLGDSQLGITIISHFNKIHPETFRLSNMDGKCLFSSPTCWSPKRILCGHLLEGRTRDPQKRVRVSSGSKSWSCDGRTAVDHPMTPRNHVKEMVFS